MRHNNNNNNQKKIHGGTNSKISKAKDINFAAGSDDEESIVVVSTPRCEWPPHKNTLSSTASSEITNSPHEHLKTSALPFSANSTDNATTTMSSSHDDGNCCTSSSPWTSTATTATTTTTTTMTTTTTLRYAARGSAIRGLLQLSDSLPYHLYLRCSSFVLAA